MTKINTDVIRDAVTTGSNNQLKLIFSLCDAYEQAVKEIERLMIIEAKAKGYSSFCNIYGNVFEEFK